jgi:hypothetical protein
MQANGLFRPEKVQVKMSARKIVGGCKYVQPYPAAGATVRPDKGRFGTDEPGTGFSATVC